jgi:hypothetical protein
MRSRSFEISGNLLKSNRIFQTAAFMLRCDPLSVSGHSQGLESAFMTLLDATIDAFTGTTKGLAHEIGRGVSGSRRACRGWPNTRSCSLDRFPPPAPAALGEAGTAQEAESLWWIEAPLVAGASN